MICFYDFDSSAMEMSALIGCPQGADHLKWALNYAPIICQITENSVSMQVGNDTFFYKFILHATGLLKGNFGGLLSYSEQGYDLDGMPMDGPGRLVPFDVVESLVHRSFIRLLARLQPTNEVAKKARELGIVAANL